MRLFILSLLLFAYCLIFAEIVAGGDYALGSGDFCLYYGCNKVDYSGHLKK
jgi:hypothetical protein